MLGCVQLVVAGVCYRLLLCLYLSVSRLTDGRQHVSTRAHAFRLVRVGCGALPARGAVISRLLPMCAAASIMELLLLSCATPVATSTAMLLVCGP